MPLIAHPESDCDICFESFDEDNPDRQPHTFNRCGHIFCATCVRRQHNCPICRTEITPGQTHRIHVETRKDQAAAEDRVLIQRIADSILDDRDDSSALGKDIEAYMTRMRQRGTYDAGPLMRLWIATLGYKLWLKERPSEGTDTSSAGPTDSQSEERPIKPLPLRNHTNSAVEAGPSNRAQNLQVGTQVTNGRQAVLAPQPHAPSGLPCPGPRAVSTGNMPRPAGFVPNAQSSRFSQTHPGFGPMRFLPRNGGLPVARTISPRPLDERLAYDPRYTAFPVPQFDDDFAWGRPVDDNLRPARF